MFSLVLEMSSSGPISKDWEVNKDVSSSVFLQHKL